MIMMVMCMYDTFWLIENHDSYSSFALWSSMAMMIDTADDDDNDSDNDPLLRRGYDDNGDGDGDYNDDDTNDDYDNEDENDNDNDLLLLPRLPRLLLPVPAARRRLNIEKLLVFSSIFIIFIFFIIFIILIINIISRSIEHWK